MCRRKCPPTSNQSRARIHPKLSPHLMTHSQTSHKPGTQQPTSPSPTTICHLPLLLPCTAKCSQFRLSKKSPTLPETTYLLPLSAEEPNHSNSRRKKSHTPLLPTINTKCQPTSKSRPRVTTLPLHHLPLNILPKPWTLPTKRLFHPEEKCHFLPKTILSAGLPFPPSPCITKPGRHPHLHLTKNNHHHMNNTKNNMSQAITKVIRKICHLLHHLLSFTKAKFLSRHSQLANKPKICQCHHHLGTTLPLLKTSHHHSSKRKMRMMMKSNSNTTSSSSSTKGHQPHSQSARCSHHQLRRTLLPLLPWRMWTE